MSQKKYVSLTRLSNFLDNIKAKYSQIGHKHTVSDLTDYEVDSELSASSLNPVQNKVLNDEFNAVATAMNALEAAIDTKSDSGHDHSSLYYTQTQLDQMLSTKSDSTHNHDSAYDTKGAAAESLVSAKSYTDTKVANLVSTSAVNTKIDTHNASTTSHSDIRDLISGLTNRLNALADSDDTTLDQLSEIVNYIKNNKSLIDGITTSKVNVADIVNNLTTNVTNKPLSAAQGVAIKTLIDALQTELDSHTHTIADVTNLQSALDEKATSSYVNDNFIKNVQIEDNLTSDASNYVLSAKQGKVLKGQIDNLNTIVDTKADAEHTHIWDNITDMTVKRGSAVGSEIFNVFDNGEDWYVENVASGDYSHAEGDNTVAEGFGSHAEGGGTTASGDYSHAEGGGTTASIDYAHAEGYLTTASGIAAHAEGRETTAYGNYAHAEGWKTNATGYYSHAEGYATNAAEYYSHAEGYETTASGRNSHTEGRGTTTSKAQAHAEGLETTASGENSHAQGRETIASGDCSHAEGWGTKASSNHQHVQGTFNIEDASNTYAHIVGNGGHDEGRSNAHTLDWDGNAWFAGDVFVGGTSQDNASPLISKADHNWVQIYDSGATTEQINSFANINISGYKKIMMAIKCVNDTTNASTTRYGSAIFKATNGTTYQLPVFNSMFFGSETTTASMAFFEFTDGWIICPQVVRSIKYADFLTSTEGGTCTNMNNMGSGLMKCTNTLSTVTISNLDQNADFFFGVGSRVIIWGSVI